MVLAVDLAEASLFQASLWVSPRAADITKASYYLSIASLVFLYLRFTFQHLIFSEHVASLKALRVL